MLGTSRGIPVIGAVFGAAMLVTSEGGVTAGSFVIGGVAVPSCTEAKDSRSAVIFDLALSGAPATFAVNVNIVTPFASAGATVDPFTLDDATTFGMVCGNVTAAGVDKDLLALAAFPAADVAAGPPVSASCLIKHPLTLSGASKAGITGVEATVPMFGAGAALDPLDPHRSSMADTTSGKCAGELSALGGAPVTGIDDDDDDDDAFVDDDKEGAVPPHSAPSATTDSSTLGVTLVAGTVPGTVRVSNDGDFQAVSKVLAGILDGTTVESESGDSAAASPLSFRKVSAAEPARGKVAALLSAGNRVTISLAIGEVRTSGTAVCKVVAPLSPRTLR